MLKKVAILVDGDFFIRRHKSYFKKFKKSNHYKPSSEELAKALHNHCLKHIDKNKEELYRIFFYDCKPLDNKAHNPKSNECIDFATTEIYKEE